MKHKKSTGTGSEQGRCSEWKKNRFLFLMLVPGLIVLFFNPSEYSEEVSAIASTCLEYKVTVLSGEADVDEILAEFNEALAANGLQTLLDAANNQYQEFLETKEK